MNPKRRHGAAAFLSSVDKYRFIVVVLIVARFGIVRVDHNALDVGVRAVKRNKRTKRKCNHKRQNNSERHEHGKNIVLHQ